MDCAAILETIRKDTVFALRTMRKKPVFSATAIFTLAVGIGGTTAMFSVIRGVLLRPLEYRDPDGLVRISADYTRLNSQNTPFSLRRFLELKGAARSFNGVGAYLHTPENVTLSDAGDPEALVEARVSADFLAILGVEPVVGRSFLAQEDTRGGPSVMMISADLWKRRFGANPRVVGKSVDLDLTPHTIIGVLPTGFAFPFPGADVWVTRPSEWSWIPSRNWDVVTDLFGFARLRPNSTLDQARAELAVLNQQYAMGHPAEAKAELRLAWLKDYLVGDVQPLLWTLFGAVGFVLLIVCANVASLMLARATSRSREFALRAALGAARGRLIRQLLAESMVLAAAGGAVGLLLARSGLAAIASGVALNGTSWAGKQLLPRAGAIRIDGLVLGFTLVVSVATGVLFGLLPALRASRADLAEALRESGAGASGGWSGRAGLPGVSVRGLLVVGQVALSIILVIGAALMIDSFVRLRNVDPGFKSADLLTVKIALPPLRYGSDQKKIAFFEELAESVRAAKGVRGAAVAMSLPTTGGVEVNVQVEGQPVLSRRDQPSAQLQSITPDYFQTLGIALRRGRDFSVRDNVRGAPPVVVINESFARRFWPDYPGGLNPVGQHIAETPDRLDSAEIVGIVADVRERGLAVAAKPEFYVPSAVHPPQTAYLVVRADGGPLRVVNTVRRLVRVIDLDQSISDARTMDEVIDASVGQKRLTSVLLGLFAGVALMLAMVGIYGVVAYSVEQRTREFAIRRALGAEPRDILRVVLGHGLALSLAGVVLGIGGALALNHVMVGLLFQVSATTPTTYSGVAALFVIVAVVASYIPARRANRIDPMVSLRNW